PTPTTARTCSTGCRARGWCRCHLRSRATCNRATRRASPERSSSPTSTTRPRGYPTRTACWSWRNLLELDEARELPRGAARLERRAPAEVAVGRRLRGAHDP